MNERWVASDGEVTGSQWTNSRILAMSLLLIGPHLPRLGAVSDVPEVLLDSRARLPLGFLASGPSLLLTGLSAILVVFAALTLYGGLRVRTFGLLTAFLLLAANSMVYSVAGKIIHHQWTAFAIALMAWTVWSGSTTVGRGISARLILAWILGWGLFTSALAKVWGGWLDPSYSAVRGELEVQGLNQAPWTAVASALRDNFGSSSLWELADYGTIALELGLVIAILKPSWFRLAVTLLILFHISILVLMQISFVAVLPAYVPFFAGYLPTAQLITKWQQILAVGLGLVATFVLLLRIPDPLGWLFSVLSAPSYLAGVLPLLLLLSIAISGQFLRARSGRAVR